MGNKRKGCLSSVFLIIIGLIVLVMVFTNPKQDEVVKELKNREGAISIINVTKRENYILLSVCQVQISSFNQGIMKEKEFLCVFGQVIEIK